jgi:hypothetical protein
VTPTRPAEPDAERRVVRVVVGRPLTEHELVERARRGDADAFGELVHVHEEIAFRTAVLITGNAADAQEAAQDAFVKAYRGLRRFHAGEPLRPWLLTIVANEARNLRRSGARRSALALRAAGEERSSGEAAPSLETALRRAPRPAPGRPRPPARARPRGDRLPLPARALRGRDRGRARRGARDSQIAPLLEFLGLKGAKIERREPNAPTTPPRRQDLGADLGLGRAVTLAQARSSAGFRVVVPELDTLGAPDVVYFQDGSPEGGRVSLVYGPRPGIARAATTGAGVLVTEFRAQASPLIQKSAGSATNVRPLTVDGRRAYFIEGSHGFAFLDEGDNATFEDQRLAGNTLLVERAGLLLRVEGDLSGAAAVCIARSAR